MFVQNDGGQRYFTLKPPPAPHGEAVSAARRVRPYRRLAQPQPPTAFASKRFRFGKPLCPTQPTITQAPKCLQVHSSHKAPTARNATPPSEACLQLSPIRRPSQAPFARPMAAGRPARTVLESPAPLQPAPSHGFSPPPQRRPACSAHRFHCRPPRPSTPLPPRALAFSGVAAARASAAAKQTPLCPLRPLGFGKVLSLQPARRPIRLAAGLFALSLVLAAACTQKPAPLRPAFAHHDFRFHLHRPNDRVSGTACLSNNSAGDATSPQNRHRSRTAKPCPLHARLGEAHRLNKHTPAGWPTHHGALTPPAPRPTNLSTILQHASGGTMPLPTRTPWEVTARTTTLGVVQPTSGLESTAPLPTKPEPL